MKKSLLMIVAIFIAGSMSAQMYVGARLGYGIGAQKYAVGTTVTDNSKENIWGSMGQGLPLGIKAGYFFNSHLGFELGINYWMGAEQTAADVTRTLGGMVYTNNITAKSSQLRVLPQIVYMSDLGVYGRFGMVIPLSGSTTVSGTEVSPGATGSTTTVSEVVYKGAFTMGFAGAFGYAFELNDNMRLFGELEYISLTIRGKTSEITTYTVNGADQLPAMTTIQKETNYIDKLDATSNNGAYNPNPDPAQPLDNLRTSTVYSSLRFNVGIVMTF